MEFPRDLMPEVDLNLTWLTKNKLRPYMLGLMFVSPRVGK